MACPNISVSAGIAFGTHGPNTKSPHDTLDKMLTEYNDFDFKMMTKGTVNEIYYRRDAIFKFIKDNHIQNHCYMKNYIL